MGIGVGTDNNNNALHVFPGSPKPNMLPLDMATRGCNVKNTYYAGHAPSNGARKDADMVIPGVHDSDNGNRPLITVNQINLTGRQIWTILTGMGSLIGAGIAGGWLFIPAKSNDLDALRAVVEIVRTEQQGSREAIGRLTMAISSLEQSVDAFRMAPPKVIERISPAPVGKPRGR